MWVCRLRFGVLYLRMPYTASSKINNMVGNSNLGRSISVNWLGNCVFGNSACDGDGLHMLLCSARSAEPNDCHVKAERRGSRYRPALRLTLITTRAMPNIYWLIIKSYLELCSPLYAVWVERSNSSSSLLIHVLAIFNSLYSSVLEPIGQGQGAANE